MELRDDYDHFDEYTEYVLESVLYEGNSNIDPEYEELKYNYNSILLNQCECNWQSNCTNCKHGGNYIKDIVQKMNDLIYECNSLCSCESNNCFNRLVQYGPRENLKIVDSKIYKSKGLITICDIPKGAFICEYAGELLTKFEAKRRHRLNELHNSMNYVLRLNELDVQQKNNRSIVTIVDPSRKGNIGRYINHSCEPNCQTISVRLDNPIPKIAIFAKKSIKAGEELTFHYNEGVLNDVASIINKFNGTNNNRKLCLCGTASCEMYLPNYEFV